MNLDDVKAKMEEVVEDMLEEDFKIVTSEQMKALRNVIDHRGLPGRVWYSEDTLVFPTKSMGMANYYAGFEYIPKEERAEFGEYTFFSGENGRVAKLLNVLNGPSEQDKHAS